MPGFQHIPESAFNSLLLRNRRWIGHDDFHASVLLSTGRIVVAGHRLSFTLAHRRYAPGIDALGYQSRLHRIRARFGEPQVVVLPADAVGVAFDGHRAIRCTLQKLRQPETRNYGFNMLVRTYQQRVYGLVRKMVIDHDDADDVTQEVFIKVHRNIDQFREDSQLYTWIYRIATNECLSFLNRKKRRFLFSLDDVKTDMIAHIDNSPLVSGDEIQKKLQKALLTLPDKQRLVFNLKYFEDLPYEEIAKITDTSVGALKASYHHAVKKIEEFLTAD